MLEPSSPNAHDDCIFSGHINQRFSWEVEPILLSVQQAAMGKIADALGFGAKGVIDIIIARDVFEGGEVIDGVIVLRIFKPVQCRELVLVVEGIERMSWSEGSEETMIRYGDEQEHIKDEIVLTTHEMFEPGEYDFPFCYQLRDKLPASYRLSGRSTKWKDSIWMNLAYKLRVSLPIIGRFSADIKAYRPFVITRQRLEHPARAVEASASKTIVKFGRISKGKCIVSAAMAQNVFVAGQKLSVKSRIKNQTSMDMSSITLMLCEDLSVYRDDDSGTTTVCSATVPGVRAGKQFSHIMLLPLVTKQNGQPINPTAGTRFGCWTYRLTIKCKFTMASSVEVTLPVVILPHDRPDDVLFVKTNVAPAIKATHGAEMAEAAHKSTI